MRHLGAQRLQPQLRLILLTALLSAAVAAAGGFVLTWPEFRVPQAHNLAFAALWLAGGACALAAAWLESLSADEDGNRGEGGWGARLVDVDEHSRRAILAITSAGEDVADGIEDGTDNLYCFLAERVRAALNPELSVEWQEGDRRQA